MLLSADKKRYGEEKNTIVSNVYEIETRNKKSYIKNYL